ncbi:MAG: hypothetical protein KIC64_01010, partial [Prevotella buccae]|uniref:hypothetical protein n=1 Tax=Segatella buccae TaxID=28126 RepID=UPI00242D3E3B
ALIFLVIATAGGNLFGFLSQLAYNSGILSKFAMAKGSAWRAPLFRSFACCRPLTLRKGLSRPCFGLQAGPNGLLKEPL